MLKGQLIMLNKITSDGYVKKKIKALTIISECSKLAQKECKTRHNKVRKIFHLELCRKLKFDPTTKWYMHKPESVLKKDVQKIV